MPEYSYARQMPRSYPEARDAAGVIVGAVRLGDARVFGADGEDKPEGAPDYWPAPDEHWLPAGEQLPPAWPDPEDSDDAAEEPGDGGEPPAPIGGKRGAGKRQAAADSQGDTSTPDGTSSEEQG